MNNKQAISAALSALTAAAMTRCATTDLPALLELHNAAANAVSALRDDGPLTGGGSSCAEFAVSALVADETPALILAELRVHTALLEVIAKQGERAAETTDSKARAKAASAGRFAPAEPPLSDAHLQRGPLDAAFMALVSLALEKRDADLYECMCVLSTHFTAKGMTEYIAMGAARSAASTEGI